MKNLFYKIYNCKDEIELDNLISSNSYLNNPKNWRLYGDNEGNFGRIGNQQSNSICALVEKITNSIDAILTKECLLKGIDPKSNSSEVPKTNKEAVEKFYNKKNGDWGYGEKAEKEKRKFAEENIQVIVTQEKENSLPNIVVYDNGEGQIPKDFPKTFLSLDENNKKKIPFVQGVFNMGSTGVLNFCGKGYQLIVSRRHKKLCKKEDYLWGFTLVRSHPLTEEEEHTTKIPWYEYFVINNEVPTFKEEKLNIDLSILKGKKNRTIKKIDFKSGTVIKMFCYNLLKNADKGFKKLERNFNSLLYDLPLPVLLYYKMDGYENMNTPDRILRGNKNKLREAIEKQKDIREIFHFSIEDKKFFGTATIPIDVIIFNKEVDNGKYIFNRPVIFLLNGQVQGFKSEYFVSKDLGLKYLKNNILIVVDCSSMGTTARNKIFMPSRDRIQEDTEQSKELLERIKAIIGNHTTLKQINEEYRGKSFSGTKNNIDFIQKYGSYLAKNTCLNNLLFGSNNKLSINSLNNKRTNEYQQDKKIEFQKYPSFFRVLNLKEKNGELYKAFHFGESGRITIQTDVDRNFLLTTKAEGKLEVNILDYSDNKIGQGDSILLPSTPTDKIKCDIAVDDGEIKIHLHPTETVNIGDKFKLFANLISPSGEEFNAIVFVEILSKKAERKKINSCLPDPIEVYREKENQERMIWSECNPLMTINDVVQLRTNTDHKIEQILINMDSELIQKLSRKQNISIKKAKNNYLANVYFNSFAMYSLFTDFIRKESKKENNDELQNENNNFLEENQDMVLDIIEKAIQEIAPSFCEISLNFPEIDLTESE